MILFVLHIDKQSCRLFSYLYCFLLNQRSNGANIGLLSLVKVLLLSKFLYVIQLLFLPVLNILLPLRADIC